MISIRIDNWMNGSFTYTLNTWDFQAMKAVLFLNQLGKRGK